VAQVLDFGTHDELPYLVMELLDGHDLDAELHARGRLPVAEAVDLVLEACVGIAQAHAAGLVHRDLKPANLFLSRSRSGRRTVKVLDFGLTKSLSDQAQSLTASAEVFGTPQYMAPEQIQSSKNVDARCDQHALALVLFELIAGRPTYTAESVPHLIVVIATHPPPPVRSIAPDVPPALEAALLRALAKRPDERFADVAAFAAAIAPFGSPRAAETAAEVAALLGTSPQAAAASVPTLAAPSLSASSPTMAAPSATISSAALARATDGARPRSSSFWIVVFVGAVAVTALAVAAGMLSRGEPAAVSPTAPSLASTVGPATAAAPIIAPVPGSPAARPTAAEASAAPGPSASPPDPPAGPSAAHPAPARSVGGAAPASSPPSTSARPPTTPITRPPRKGPCTGLDCY
jgi:serine/threonine-protein kinase